MSGTNGVTPYLQLLAGVSGLAVGLWCCWVYWKPISSKRKEDGPDHRTTRSA